MEFDLQTFLGLSGMHFPDFGEGGPRGVCFASGSNRPCEIKGFALAGIPPGLAAPEILLKRERNGSMFKEDSVETLERLGGTGLPVFLDSGAYTAYQKGTEIDAAGWELRFSLYERLARALGTQLYVVGPDKIMDQAATLHLNRVHAERIRTIASLGAQILLPMQPGEIPLDQYLEGVWTILGLPVIPAFPMRTIKEGPLKGQRMTAPQAVVEFVEKENPEKIHLLGLGAASSDGPELLEALWQVKPDLYISQDAMLLKSRLGTKDAPRKFDLVMAISEQVFCDGPFDAGKAWDESWDHTDEIGNPSDWLTKKPAEEIAKAMSMTQEETKRFVADPSAFMASPWDGGLTWWDNGYLELLLDDAWAEYVRGLTGQQRRMWSIPQAFDDHPAAGQFTAVQKVFVGDTDPGSQIDVDDQLRLLAELDALAADRAASRDRWRKDPAIPMLAGTCATTIPLFPQFLEASC